MVSLTFWGLATFGGGGGGVVTFGGLLFSGFINSHFRGVVTFEGSLLSEIYGSVFVSGCPALLIPPC